MLLLPCWLCAFFVISSLRVVNWWCWWWRRGGCVTNALPMQLTVTYVYRIVPSVQSIGDPGEFAGRLQYPPNDRSAPARMCHCGTL